MCYRNATMLAIKDPTLTYVEGYALGGFFPMEHAWCVDQYGMVIDTTWEFPAASQYYGVPIATSYVRSRILAKDSYGIIFDWESGYPILDEDTNVWLPERYRS
jgi:hypothetical protein